jgi:3-methyladenine DNA glycosylase AlkD
MPAHQPLIDALRAAFATHADPTQAGPMQAYMKSALPFRGIHTPLRRQLCTEAIKAQPAPDAEALAATMLKLWREARWREERYAAMEMARVGPHKAWLGLPLLPVFEEMIVSGAWWDCCDDISGEAIGKLFERHPGAMKPVLRRWAEGSDLWLRRAAITCQRGLKTSFDAPLFYACILPSIGDSPLAGEFFLRKGIGWALRERSYRAAKEVQAFCDEYREQLSPLTLREGLRIIEQRATAKQARQ